VKIKVTEPNSYSRVMEIEIPWTELEGDFEKAIQDFKKRIKLPGFRPGKVPNKVIMSQYLPAIEGDFVDKNLNKYYLAALQEKNITPVNQGQVTDVHFHYEKDFKISVNCEVEPEVVLPALKKSTLKAKLTKYVVDKEDIDLALDEMRRQHSEVKTVEEGAKEGHFILANLQRLDASGLPIIGDKVESRFIRIGDPPFDGDYAAALVGVKRGEKVRVTLPGATPAETSLYEVEALNIEEQILPEVDEDFVKKVDPEAKTVEEMRNRVKTRVEDNYTQRAEDTLDRDISDALIDLADLEYPSSMAEAYLDHIVEDLKRSEQNAALDEEKVRETYKEIAARNLKWYLLRKAIINQEKLEVSKDDVNEEIKKLLERSPEHVKEIEKYYKKPSNRTRIEDNLMEKNVLDYLKGFTKIKEVKVNTKDLRKANSDKESK